MSKITLCIPSRGNPELLCATLLSFDQMAHHGAGYIVYVVIYDYNDPKTLEALVNLADSGVLRGRLKVIEAKIPFQSLGEYWTAAAFNEGSDYYMALGDDGFCMTVGWDTGIENLMKSSDMGVKSWTDVGLPGLAGCYIVNNKWLKAAGYLMYGVFPYWFCDVWLHEVSAFVYNKKIEIIPNIMLFSRQAATQNLRDLDFWWGYFNATRPMRLEEAKIIAEKLDLKFDDSRDELIKEFIARDLHFRGDRVAALEKRRGERKPPTERYLKSLDKAKLFLAENHLHPWQYIKLPF